MSDIIVNLAESLEKAQAHIAELEAKYNKVFAQLDETDAERERAEAEVARLKYQLDLACVDIAVYIEVNVSEDDPRIGSSDAVHADLERRWAERGTGT